MKEEIKEYVLSVQDELIQLIKDLCAIPSFSHHEEKKAAFIIDWFKKEGITATMDEHKNVVVPVNMTDHMTVFMAHIDTVFPDEVGFDCIEKEGQLWAPGVGDDTANVAELMLITRYLIQHHYLCEKGCLVVLNSCEEGLGNLEGSKGIYDDFTGRFDELYSFDGGYKGVVDKAVGSLRYQVNVKTEGGHSYGAFGNRNAIAYASSMISTLYDYKVPNRGKSTYNVGTIHGGTSVNTIAQDVSFLFEYRSDNQEDLKEMNEFFFSVISTYQKMGISVEVILLGERPGMGPVDEEKMQAARDRINTISEEVTGTKPSYHSGSTDCNIPLSHGITSLCFGGYEGKGAHTREEHLEISSLVPGMSIVMSFMMEYFK